ncbi:MAG: SpoIIE family protein phosphatase [Coriobacteriia bacterium]|nr:SpoIIE family protein phosphatase [Coriobacteriia bacterium]
MKKRAGASLSTRVTVLTFVAVTLSALVISAVSIAGVYNLARSEDQSRLAAYRRLMLDDITARLTIVDRVVDSLATIPDASTATRDELQRSVVRSASANVEYFDTLMYTDASGTVLAAAPAEHAPGSLAAATYLPVTTGADAVFGWEDTGVATTSRLWIIRRVPDGGRVINVVGRVRTGFMARIVDDVSSARETVSALVVDGHRDVVTSGEGSARFSSRSITMLPEAPGAGRGTATVQQSDFGRLSGYYADVAAAPELRWRVVVLESETAVFMRAREALVPAGVATFGVALLAVFVALAYSRRLLAPVKAFERRAREVASGGYVRPMKIERDDELGRLADAFNEMGVRLNSLQDMAQLLASASKLNDVLDAVLDAVGHILGTGDAAILLTDDDGLALMLVRGRGLAVPAATLLVPIDDPSPITEAFHEQRPAAFQGSGGEWSSPLHRLFGADAARSGVVVPLVMGREVLGVVVVLAAGSRRFTDAQVETLRAFSANAAVAVRNSRLYEYEHVSRTEAEALREVAELIVRPTDLAEALDRAAGIAAELLDMSGWYLAVEGREQIGLDPPASVEESRRLMRAWRMVEPGGEGADSPRFDPVVIPDVQAEAGLRELLGHEVGSALLVPLVQGSAVRGVLALVDEQRGRVLLSRHVALAGTIGKELSLAIRNAFLLQQARTRAANLETVFRISQAVSSELQINVVLNRVLDVVQKIFSADAVALMSYDMGRRCIVTSMARGVSNREMLYFQTPPGVDIPGKVYETRTPAAHGELLRVSTPLASLAVNQGLHSMIAVPLMARGKSIGVLVVYARDADAFSGEDMELLLTFAAQAALAIDTASLYGKEHHVSSMLQASILPERLPEIAGLETASFYLPAGAEADIGGDYYDLFVTRDGKVVFAIGDVCGKGVLAATKTSMIKYALRGLVAAGAGPADSLAELNHLVAMSGDPSDIVTAWVGFLDLEKRRLVYADGGHPPGLLWKPAERRIERLAATGPLLGAVPGVEYIQRSVSLEDDDVLLLYTDGVTEARRGSKFFGEGRVRRVVRKAETARELVQQLLGAVQEFSAGPLRDDAAALAIRFLRRDV